MVSTEDNLQRIPHALIFPKLDALCITDSNQKLVCLYHSCLYYSVGTLLNGKVMEAPATLMKSASTVPCGMWNASAHLWCSSNSLCTDKDCRQKFVVTVTFLRLVEASLPALVVVALVPFPLVDFFHFPLLCGILNCHVPIETKINRGQ